jgi:hypothetical protein
LRRFVPAKVAMNGFLDHGLEFIQVLALRHYASSRVGSVP